MIYLGNGIWSDSGPSLSHGGPWKDHKYIAIKNGRYIYPDDGGSTKKIQNPNGGNVRRRDEAALNKAVTGVNAGANAITSSARKYKYDKAVSSQGPSQAEKAQTYMYNPYYKNTMNYGREQGDAYGSDWVRNSKNVDTGKSHESSFKKYLNQENHYYDKYYPEMSTPKKRALSLLNATLNVAEDAYDKGIDKAEDKIQELKDKKKYGKLYGTIKVTEPSAAQKAQTSGLSSYSKNVKGYDSMQAKAYKTKYGQMGIANGGPSAAELAQRNKETDKNSNAYKVKYGEMGKANGGPSAAQKAQTAPYGASKNTSTGSKTVQYKKQLTDSNKKYQKAVSSQGPSAAQKAQSYAKDGYSGTSKNVGVGTKKVTYSESKYNKSVTNQGPSAAQKAQSYNKAGISTKSKNVNSGSKKVNYTHADYGPKKKKKKPFEKAIEWIKGAPGKVSVKSSYKTPKK